MKQTFNKKNSKNFNFLYIITRAHQKMRKKMIISKFSCITFIKNINNMRSNNINRNSSMLLLNMLTVNNIITPQYYLFKPKLQTINSFFFWEYRAATWKLHFAFYYSKIKQILTKFSFKFKENATIVNAYRFSCVIFYNKSYVDTLCTQESMCNSYINHNNLVVLQATTFLNNMRLYYQSRESHSQSTFDANIKREIYIFFKFIICKVIYIYSFWCVLLLFRFGKFNSFINLELYFSISMNN